MCVECRLKFVLIETDPGRAELVAVLPSEAEIWPAAFMTRPMMEGSNNS